MQDGAKKDSALAGVVWAFSERILAQIVSLVVSIILARLLLPSEYGIVALVMVFITIANVFVSYGLGDALIQKKDADARDFSTIFYCNITISILIYGLIIVAAPLIADFYHEPLLIPVVRILGIKIPIAAINSIQHAYVSKHMQFRKFFFSTLGGTLFSGVVGIWMAYRGYGVWALVAQYLMNTCIDTMVLFITVKWRPTLQYSVKTAKELLSFGWKATLAALVNSVYTSLRSLIIGRVYGSADLAFYNKGNAYPCLIITNINTSISRVTYPVLSNNKQDEKKYIELLRKAVRNSSYVVHPGLVLLMVVAQPFISFLLTEKWMPCVPFLQILCVYYMAEPLLTSYSNVLKSLGRSDLQLKMEVLTKFIGVLLIVIGMRFSALALAISATITAFVSVFIGMVFVRKVVKYSPIDQIKDSCASLLLSFFVGFPVYLMNYIQLPDVVLILIQSALFASLYLLFSNLLKMEGFLYVMQSFKRLRNR